MNKPTLHLHKDCRWGGRNGRGSAPHGDFVQGRSGISCLEHWRSKARVCRTCHVLLLLFLTLKVIGITLPAFHWLKLVTWPCQAWEVGARGSAHGDGGTDAIDESVCRSLPSWHRPHLLMMGSLNPSMCSGPCT